MNHVAFPTAGRRLSLLLLACFLAFAGARAGQAKPTRQEARAIAAAKRALVSRLDPKLPRVTLERWLRQLVGPSAPIEWRVDDCGEQSGTPADRGRDFPMCVEATAPLGDGRSVSLSVQVGTFKTGVSGRPVERMHFLERGGKYEDVRHLSDFPARIRERPRPKPEGPGG
ncbi:MAG: hypothetical protein K0Q72_3893 [Armatimonadetes bacterium]|nr:hypothetical protein [Armatimonadota bacterium]